MSLHSSIIGSPPTPDSSNPDAQFGGDLNTMAKYWVKKTADMLKTNLVKKKIKLTGELIDSVSWQIHEGETPGVSIYFAVHGRILEMKTLFWSKSPPYDVILKWVKSKPMSTWAYVPGYEYKSMSGIPSGMDNDKAQKRIAWAIVKDRARGEAVNQYGRWGKKKQWQNPGGKGNKSNLNTAMSHLMRLLEEEIAASATGKIITAIMQ